MDVVAASHSERALVVREYRWWSAPVGANVLAELRRRAARLEGQGWRVVNYYLLSCSGFTPGLEQVVAHGEVRLVSVSDVVGSEADGAR